MTAWIPATWAAAIEASRFEQVAKFFEPSAVALLRKPRAERTHQGALHRGGRQIVNSLQQRIHRFDSSTAVVTARIW